MKFNPKLHKKPVEEFTQDYRNEKDNPAHPNEQTTYTAQQPLHFKIHGLGIDIGQFTLHTRYKKKLLGLNIENQAASLLIGIDTTYEGHEREGDLQAATRGEATDQEKVKFAHEIRKALARKLGWKESADKHDYSIHAPEHCTDPLAELSKAMKELRSIAAAYGRDEDPLNLGPTPEWKVRPNPMHAAEAPAAAAGNGGILSWEERAEEEKNKGILDLMKKSFPIGKTVTQGDHILFADALKKLGRGRNG
jgi:hypothetical protein